MDARIIHALDKSTLELLSPVVESCILSDHVQTQYNCLAEKNWLNAEKKDTSCSRRV